MDRPYSLRELLQSDVAVWGDIWFGQHAPRGYDAAAVARMLVSFVGLRATLLYRVSHVLQRAGVRFWPQVLSRLNVMLHGLDIPASVPIGPGLYIPHPVGTVVMAERVGAHLTLVSGVTLGMRNEHAFPILGNNVYVGAGARVLGRIRIGDNVNIGANAVVLRDVPDNAVAVGVPAAIRLRNAPGESVGQPLAPR